VFKGNVYPHDAKRAFLNKISSALRIENEIILVRATMIWTDPINLEGLEERFASKKLIIVIILLRIRMTKDLVTSLNYHKNYNCLLMTLQR
jgi:hypothetical protein